MRNRFRPIFVQVMDQQTGALKVACAPSSKEAFEFIDKHCITGCDWTMSSDLEIRTKVGKPSSITFIDVLN